MILSDLSIRRPVLATVMSLVIVVFGAASLLRLPVREYPDIDRPVVSITTSYAGAAPEIVDNDITEVIEGAISGIAGIRNINSSSRTGSSRTSVEFETGRDIDAAVSDIRDAVNRVLNQLPADADPPRIAKSDADAQPMMYVSLTSDRLSATEMTDYAERTLVDRLSILDGVAQVTVGGQRRHAMRIWLDRRAMAARDVTVDDVEAALRRNNVELPAGLIESVAREQTVRTDSRLRSVADFANLLIRESQGNPVRLADVARVEAGVEDTSTSTRTNGQTAIGLGIIRQSQANTVAVAEAVRAELDRIRPTLPAGLDMSVSYDQSVFISQTIDEVLRTLAIAAVLVILVIFVFLRSIRATFIPAVTIPVSIVGTFSVMALLGFSLNVLTLLSLILAIGLVVDDAIVVLENIQRRIEEGEPPLIAALHGSRQVAFAVIATTLTLMAVFVPITLMQGSVGRLFTEFGFVLAAAVGLSGLVALTLTPMLCSKWLRSTASSGWFMRTTERGFVALVAGYRRLLRRALGMPIVILAAAAAVAAMAVLLLGLLPRELEPTADRGSFIVSVQAPQGATAAYTDASVRQIEQILQPLVERGEVTRVFSILGAGGSNDRAFIIVGLAPWSERSRSAQQIVAGLAPQLAQVTGVRAIAVNPPGLGQRGFNQGVQFVIGGPDHATVQGWVDRILQRIRQNPNLQNVNSDFEQTRPQLDVAIDRARAADLGVPVDVIGRTLQTMLASRQVTSYVEAGREYEVILQAAPEDRAQPTDLRNIFVRSTTTGTLIPLSSLITLKETGTAPSLNRIDRLPSITISASLAPGYDLGSAIDYLTGVAAADLPPGARTGFQGVAQEYQEASGSVYLTFGLALLIVFLVLAAQFESFVHPAIILMSVPLALTGALASLLLSGTSFNIFSQIGLILLVGMMAKNGILIVEFANQLRDRGAPVREAIVEGAVLRLRPILMTTIATVFGAVPLVLSSGAGAESRAAIGVVIVGGLTFATLLTLFVTPVLYDLVARFTRPASAVAREIERLTGGELPAPGE